MFKAKGIITAITLFMGTGLLLGAPASALTLKKGEVLSSDGQIYEGASPENIKGLIARAKARDEPAGVVGRNVFVVVGETVTFVPIVDIRDRQKDEVIEIVGDRVVQNVSGVKQLKFEQLQALTAFTDATGISVTEIKDISDLETLPAETVQKIKTFTTDSGISIENIAAVNDAIAEIPDAKVDGVLGQLETLIDQGFASEVDSFLSEIGQIDGGLEALAKYGSYEECVAGSGAETCNAINEVLDDRNI